MPSRTAWVSFGKRHRNGRGGMRSTNTGQRGLANKNGTAKPGATGSGSETGNHQSQKQLTRPPG
jgi:hypothetical protein